MSHTVIHRNTNPIGFIAGMDSNATTKGRSYELVKDGAGWHLLFGDDGRVWGMFHGHVGIMVDAGELVFQRHDDAERIMEMVYYA